MGSSNVTVLQVGKKETRNAKMEGKEWKRADGPSENSLGIPETLDSFVNYRKCQEHPSSRKTKLARGDLFQTVVDDTCHSAPFPGLNPSSLLMPGVLVARSSQLSAFFRIPRTEESSLALSHSLFL